ncbi:MAG: GIY-YIG nuclease family protein [Pseudoxanthomonas sp.]
MSYFTYVFPCVWEDYCKVGFSRDPLSRLQALHSRWFEFFDVDRLLLVASDSEREARDLELELRKPLKFHKAPMPLTISTRAGGFTEWLRGSYKPLEEKLEVLRQLGYAVEASPRAWVRNSLEDRSDRLFAWTEATLQIEGGEAATGPQSVVLDTLDAYTSFGLEVESRVSPETFAWYRSRSHLSEALEDFRCASSDP